jgi:outer membrane protein TolC
MWRNKTILICLFMLSFSTAFSQDTIVKELKWNEFMQLVKQNHPVAKQADLILKSGSATTLSARGNFDPKLFYEFKNKFYDSKNYYALENGGFKIPTWFGIELKAGYEQNEGYFLNPENNNPSNGLLYSQLSLPLLQGLLIDERRAVLKQAKLFETASTFEQINMINELLYKASKVYWDWQLAYNNVLVYETAIALSEERLTGVKKTALLGDRPTIDTVEANIQLQDRMVNYQQSLVEYQTKTFILSNYLWLENNVPIELTASIQPAVSVATDDKEMELVMAKNMLELDSLINNHPLVKVYDLKLQQLMVDKRYKQDKLKPMVNVTYNPLFNPDKINYTFNNYKWGIAVGFPILLRKERGELQLAKIKIENIEYETRYKKNELANTFKATVNEYKNYKKQLAIYSNNVQNYERLWLSEKKLFDAGESSLFMVNSREMSYINAKIKLNELINKNKKTAIEVTYSAGQLYKLN